MVRLLIAATAILALLAAGYPADASPLCFGRNPTLSEELAAADAAVIGILTAIGPAAADDVPLARFVITKVLKGAKRIAGEKHIHAVLPFAAKAGDLFFLTARMAEDEVPEGKEGAGEPQDEPQERQPPHLAWSSPLPITAASEDYLVRLPGLPQGTPRLKFFLGYLEHREELLAQDAFVELSEASYDQLQTLKERLNHARLTEQVRDYRSVVGSRRRFYFTLLGIAGDAEDVPMLMAMLRSDDPKERQPLDALLSCLLALDPGQTLPLIDEIYLADPKADFAETYAAIVALRTAGKDVVPVKRICESLRLVLARPELADLVIPDLARREDWSAMPRLVELFKTADEKKTWVRLPVVNYLRDCPLPEAKQHLAELRQLDPQIFQRADEFFPRAK